MGLSLQEKEKKVKIVLGKKIKVLTGNPQGQLIHFDTELKTYRELPSDQMILVIYDVEPGVESVVNADIIKVLDDETGLYIDLW
jgi:hypothetical protein